jgi:arylsulfatase A-like enzyme
MSNPRLAALLLAGALAGCGEAPPPDAPSVLLVSLDTVRADHTSLQGYARDTTPNLARLAREGVRFERPYAMTSTTGPTHGTLFTGRHAPAHGVHHNGVPLPAEERTLAERLAARGYRTAGFVGSFVLSERFGFAQGFELWDEEFSREGSSLPMGSWEGHAVPGGGFDRSAAETTRRAVAWLEGRADEPRPFFLFVHYFDAHEPYTPEPEFEAAFRAAPDAPAELREVARYDAEIAQVDAQLGVLLAALERVGRAEDTIVVVVSDHGQGLTDHNDAFHSVNLYEESVRAVWVVRWPAGLEGGRVVSGAVEQVDLVPTLLDQVAPGSHAGLDLPGRSLVAAMSGRAQLEADRPVFLYRQWYPRRRVRGVNVTGEQFGVRVGDWKYIEGTRDGRRELYDLANDPGEHTNLYKRSELEARRSALRDVLASWRTTLPEDRSAPRLSEEERAKLRALGYVD